MTRDHWLSLTDAQLLASCEEDYYRASGPGGQKRNKTESAVRLRHAPTGQIVVATESRSRQENRDRALKRMRESIALRVRQPITEDTVPDVVATACSQGDIRIGIKSPAFLPVAAYVLDLMETHQGRLSDMVDPLGVVTAQIVKFLNAKETLWQEAQQIRQRHSLPLLKAR